VRQALHRGGFALEAGHAIGALGLALAGDWDQHLDGGSLATVVDVTGCKHRAHAAATHQRVDAPLLADQLKHQRKLAARTGGIRRWIAGRAGQAELFRFFGHRAQPSSRRDGLHCHLSSQRDTSPSDPRA
jgi:hypothetical protein